MRDDIINEEICFDEGNNHISILASKDCKMVVCVAWEISRYAECNDRECTRAIPIRDLYLFLRDKDKFINEEAKKLSGKEIAELRQMFEIKTKELREANCLNAALEEKLKALRTALREVRKNE